MKKDLQYYMELPYSVVLFADEDGHWFAKIPDLKGLMGDGATKLEALEDLEVAKKAWLTVALEDDEEIPEPSLQIV